MPIQDSQLKDLMGEAKAWNRAFLTLMPPNLDVKRPQDMVELWHGGAQFRLYQWGPITNADELKLRMAGFTHITFVWQGEPGSRPEHYDMVLK